MYKQYKLSPQNIVKMTGSEHAALVVSAKQALRRQPHTDFKTRDERVRDYLALSVVVFIYHSCERGAVFLRQSRLDYLIQAAELLHVFYVRLGFVAMGFFGANSPEIQVADCFFVHFYSPPKYVLFDFLPASGGEKVIMRYKSSLNYTTYIYQYIEINTYMCGFFCLVRVITIISYIDL